VYYNDTTDSDFINFSLSAGFSYKFNKQFSVDFALGRGVRSPDMTERFIILLPVGYDNYDYLGNPQLKPENNQQADLTLNFDDDKFGRISLNGFFSWITDYITGIKVPPSEVMPQTKDVLGVKKFENIDNAWLYGFEFTWFSPAKKPFGGSLIAAYTAGINPKAVNYIVENGQVVGSETVINDPLPEIPPFETNIRFHYNLFDNKLKPEIHLRFVAPQNRISKAYDEQTTPGFFTAGINANYTVSKYLSFTGGISNIFDNAYYEHLNRRIIGSKAPLYEPGRIFYLNVIVKF
jgi:iron complex outermembrane receptor protein